MCVCVGGTSSGLLIENHGPSFAVEVPYCTCRSLSPGRWRWRLCEGRQMLVKEPEEVLLFWEALCPRPIGPLAFSLGQPTSWLESFPCRMLRLSTCTIVSTHPRVINAGKRQGWCSWEQCFLAGSSAVMAERAWGILYWGRACLVALSCHFLARDSFILLVAFSLPCLIRGEESQDFLLDSLPTGEGRVGSRLLQVPILISLSFLGHLPSAGRSCDGSVNSFVLGLCHLPKGTSLLSLH